MNDIKLFSNGCLNCNKLKTKLDEKEIKYEMFSDLEEIIDRGFRTVPVLKIGDTYLNYAESMQYINQY